MLTQLLHLLATHENGLSLTEISRALHAQPSAVFAMLRVLEQKGKLLALGPDGSCCAACGQVSDCQLLAARGGRYVVVPRVS